MKIGFSHSGVPYWFLVCRITTI